MNTPMTTEPTTETGAERKPAPRAAAPAPSFEARERENGAPRHDASEFRETVERGYGWGV